jgi:5-methylthioadenosine/S-adenosylhomocysteine deaminase
MSILIKNADILTQNTKREHLRGDIYIEGQNIIQISEKPILVEADFKIYGDKKLVLPGLINTHTHTPMTLLRGYGDDMVLRKWLGERIWPVEARLDRRSIEAGAKLGLLEMISSGTTAFLDMYFFEDVIGEVTEKAGLRGFLGFALIDFGTPEYPADKMISGCERFVKKWKDHELVTPMIAPHSSYTCGSESLQKAVKIAVKYDVRLHTHCSETREEVYDAQRKCGLRPIAQLQKMGLLCDRMILAHCGWITKKEVVDIKKAGSSVSHCPVSNMKIATGGFTPVPELIDAGVPVGLGTDGAASNNTLDMFDTMKFCALIHKHHRWDPSILPAQTVLDFATINGGHMLGCEAIGSIEEGKKADIIILDLQKPRLTPLHDVVSHLVYAAQGGDVSTTIVNGEPLMLEHVYLTLDRYEVLEHAETYAKDLTTSG